MLFAFCFLMDKTKALIRKIFTNRAQKPDFIMERVMGGDMNAQSDMAELALNSRNARACYYMGRIYTMGAKSTEDLIEAYAWFALAGKECPKIPEVTEALKSHRLNEQQVHAALRRSLELQMSVFVR